MRRSSVLALFALLVWSAAAVAQGRAVPRPGPRLVPPPVRPLLVTRPLVPVIVPLVGVPWFGAPLVFNPYLDVRPTVSAAWTFVNPYFINPWPTYVFIGTTTPIHPQLVFKDGTTYTVRDYWRVDDQVRFITIEDGGTKSVEHTVPLSDLDVQRTTDADAASGFRFVLRNEPIEQWLRDHGSTPLPH